MNFLAQVFLLLCYCFCLTGLTNLAFRSAPCSTISKQTFTIFVISTEGAQITSVITPSSVTRFLLGILEPGVCHNRWRRRYDLMLRWRIDIKQQLDYCGRKTMRLMKMWWLLESLGFLSFTFGLLTCNLATPIMGCILFTLGLCAS
ncbi:hypothetical protein RchiOBHm_Chr2g0175741 [Rosa chinensis]|uniref:Uncharacterized protein n=1 Tax=Rosa chinensis TaxID=74649 RepID=A0A2P6S6K5_ROSCH|nr:hypothetical protein RchiOBHm_Chr2g0175741 [Rosa chinensis]